jgi:hypothetical protein
MKVIIKSSENVKSISIHIQLLGWMKGTATFIAALSQPFQSTSSFTAE